MVKTWVRHKTTEALLNDGWRLVAVGGWWRLEVGGWRLVVGGWWSPGAVLAVLNKKKRILKDSPPPPPYTRPLLRAHWTTYGFALNVPMYACTEVIDPVVDVDAKPHVRVIGGWALGRHRRKPEAHVNRPSVVLRARDLQMAARTGNVIELPPFLHKPQRLLLDAEAREQTHPATLPNNMACH